MSVAANVSQITQQLQQDLQNELATANQLLSLISMELQEIKQMTKSDGEIEVNIKYNATLMNTLANINKVPIAR